MTVKPTWLIMVPRSPTIMRLQIISDSMTPQEAEGVQEDLGIERDTPEHVKLERSALFQQKMVPAKRKR